MLAARPHVRQAPRPRPAEADARLERQVREQLVHAPARACELRYVGAVQDFLEAEEVVVLEKVAGDLEDGSAGRMGRLTMVRTSGNIGIK